MIAKVDVYLDKNFRWDAWVRRKSEVRMVMGASRRGWLLRSEGEGGMVGIYGPGPQKPTK